MSLNQNNLYEFSGFRIDLSERTLWYDDEFIALPPKVMETLCLLVENHGRLMTKDELIEELWADSFVEERNLTQNIFTLRKVLGEKEKGGKFIETVPRRGYRFVAEVHRVEIQQELVQVSHSKQTRITAEGFVSTQELTDAVREITQTLVLEKEIEAAAPRQIPASPPKPFYKSVFLPAMGVLFLLALSAFFLLWSKDFFNDRNMTFATSAEMPLLEFERLTDSGKMFFPIVSPNKQFLAYVVMDQSKFSIRLQNIATKSVTTVIEPTEMDIGAPVFSADGNYLYFRGVPGVGKTGNIYQIPIFGGSPRIVVRDARSGVGISADGEWLAFFRYELESKGTHLIVCRTDGSEEKVITTRREPDYYLVWGHAPFWAPDGKKIGAAVLTESSDQKTDKKKYYFVEIDIEKKAEKVIPSPEWNRVYRTIWMPDGKSLMTLAQDKENSPFQIWQLSYPDGQARRITNDLNDYRFISAAPDGSFLTATQERAYSNLWLIPADNPAQSRQLTFSSELKHAQFGLEWTTDGKRLVYPVIEGLLNSNLWMMDVETLERRQLTFDEGAQHRYLSVMPDGKSVIFTSNRTGNWHVWQIDLDGTNLRQIVNDVGEFFPSVTPDGKWIFYTTPGDVPITLWKKSLTDDAPPIKIREHAAATRAITADSKYAVVTYMVTEGEEKLASKYGIMSLENNSEPEDVGFNPYMTGIDWKNDGSGFYYVKAFGENLNNVWLYTPATKTHRQISSFKDRMYSISLSPDGNTLAAARGETASNIFKISGF